MRKFLIGLVIVVAAAAGLVYWLAGVAERSAAEPKEIRMEIDNVL